MKTTFQLRIESDELDQIKSYASLNNTGVSDVFRDGAKIVITGVHTGSKAVHTNENNVITRVVHTPPPADGEDYAAIVRALEEKINTLEQELSKRPKNEKLCKLVEIVQASNGHVQTASKLNESGLLDKPTDSEPLFPVKPAPKTIQAIFKNPKVNRLVDRFMALCPRLTDDGVKMVSEIMTQWEDKIDQM